MSNSREGNLPAIAGIVAVLIRVWVVCIFVTQIWTMLYILAILSFAKFTDNSTDQLGLIDLGFMCATLGVSAMGWFAAKPLARLIAKPFDHERIVANISGDQLLAGGTFLLGLWLVATTLPHLAAGITEWSTGGTTTQIFEGSETLTFHDYGIRLDTIFQLAIGLAITISALRLESILNRLRTAGLIKPVNERPDR